MHSKRKMTNKTAKEIYIDQISDMKNHSQPVAQILCRGTTFEEDEVQKVLEDVQHLALTTCFCRETLNQCDAETEVCIALNDKALQLIKEGKGKKVDQERVYQLLEQTWKSGLIHLLRFKEGEPTKKEYLCSCCPCCCVYLKPLEEGITSHLLKSEYAACVDEEVCMGCGLCQEICAFQARNIGTGINIRNGVGQVDVEQCYGCGICAKICPTRATTVEKRD